MKYFIAAIKKYAQPGGRASRKEYWMFTLVWVVLYFLLSFLDGFLGFGGSLAAFYILITACPAICISVRRLHDVGKSAWWHLAYYLPIVTFYVFYLHIKAGDTTANRYGAPNQL